MARILNIFLEAQKVGVLEQDDSGAIWFGYDVAWLESNAAMPLSISLPLQTERFKGRECRPFFAGLLPEEENREVVARKFGVSERNDFAILERIGAECAGAVSLLPPGEQPMVGVANYREVGMSELEDRLENLPTAPLMAGEDGIRLSLAGAQGKAAVAIRDGTYFLPVDGSPSTHILKPDSRRFPGLVENEFFCMRLAAGVGLDVAPVETGTAGEVSFLQVERYDRLGLESGGWARLHQEDFCQALGVAPELKYQSEGGPGLKECFQLIREVSREPIFDILKLFDSVVFNYLIGNNDAHGKNFSLIYREGEACLAPLYDLVSTASYPELSNRMAMKIGGENEARRLRSKHWFKFFTDAELGPSMAIQRMRNLASKVKSEVRSLRKDVAGIDKVAETALANCEALISLNWQREDR